ncbi:MAG: hypothetical protein OEY84_02150 [Rhodospirillaceae bacterium]|nr:hypothetical protein [Rhodospirillaceae bacterium]
MKFYKTIKWGWLIPRSAMAALAFVLVVGCSEESSGPVNKMIGTWAIDHKGLTANKKAYIMATQGAKEITFTATSAKSGSMEMGVEYEPTKNGFIVTFAGMKEGTEYKFIDDNTFEIYIPEVGFFRYIRQIQPAPEKTK